MIQTWLIRLTLISLLTGGVLYFVYDQGKDVERQKCNEAVIAGAKGNINIEVKQSEIRNTAISDDDLYDILYSGSFGRP